MSKKRYGNELHPLYSRWLSMNQRCNNPDSDNYPNYGARGIKISAQLTSFSNYCVYVEALPGYDTTKSLDRINNDGDYTVGNLRWVEHSIQTCNQRYSGKGFNKYTGVNWSKTHNRWVARVTLRGKTLMSKVCITEREAYDARCNYIKAHNLPHIIQAWTG